MRTPSPTRRLAATLGAAGLLVALAVPAGALATDTTTCDPLVTHAPTGSDGDVHAVAITSQALDADTPGWARVGWQAAPDTDLTEVVITRSDGTERLTEGDLSTGHAEEVLELAFCGRVAEADDAHRAEPVEKDGSGNGSTKDAGTAEEAATPPTDETVATEEPDDEATTEPSSAGATADPEPAPQPTEAPAPSSEEPVDAPDEHAAIPEEPADTEDSDTRASSSESAGDGEVEVLGVTLTAPDADETDTGDATEAVTAAAPLAGNDTGLPGIFAGGLAGLLAAAGALTGARHLQRRGER